MNTQVLLLTLAVMTALGDNNQQVRERIKRQSGQKDEPMENEPNQAEVCEYNI